MKRKIIELEEGWSYIVTKLNEIIEAEPEPKCNSVQYSDIYKTIYNMCTQKPPHDYSQQIYDGYFQVIVDYTKQTVYKEMQSKAKDAVLAYIRRGREGEEIDYEVLKNVLNFYVEYGMGTMEKYEEDIESFIIQDTTSYYSCKALSWIQEDSCPQYMLKAEECLNREDRVTHCLHSSTVPKLVKIVRNELLVVVAKQLIENEHSGCLALLRDAKKDDLSRMFRLFRLIPQALESIVDLSKKHVTAEASFLIKQAEDAATNQEQEVRLQVLIRIVIKLHNKYMECFQNRFQFHKALQEVFEIFCNKKVAGSSSNAELLATFCDNLLKKGGSEKMSDEAIEAKLENIVKFLVYISDKDLFSEFYRKKQARRLLFDRSANDEHERSVLTKLKEQFGGQFTSKMEGMVTDMTMARESQNNFKEYIATNMTANTGIDFTVTVLTTGFWPSYKTCDLKLPSEMAKCVEVFKAFYETKTKHRRLQWIYSLGTCHIIGKFDQKPIELIVSTYQAAVLLLFNNTERLSYNEMLEQLNLSHEDLVRLLHSLSCAKYKILIKEPMSKSISRTDVFEYNSMFTDRMRRIKIPLASMDERKKVVEDVDKDRRYAIDASLVRIMKSRKVLGHQQLVSECVEHLSRMFKPDIKMIKKRIEDLISRDYLERDYENPSILNTEMPSNTEGSWHDMLPQPGICHVYHEMQSEAKEAVLKLIHGGREGEQIDYELLKNVLDVYVEIGMGNMEKYEEDFEVFMLQDTTSYYSHKASSWIQDDSCPEYMLKAEKCLKKERERATHYLHSSTETKLVKIVQNELLVVFAKELLENEHSGFLALLRDNKMDDLSRIYRLYHSIPQGLELVADLFNKHVTAEGTILIKQAEDAATTQSANTCGVEEQLLRLQVLIGIVLELRDKYMVYVTECFQNRFLFHKALQVAFEIFCNKKVAGSSSNAELLATFCDNLLKKGGSDNLSDEAIEAWLENVVEFLVYISDKDLFAEFYRKKQARRLLFDRCSNEGHERSILTKLKEQFGREFTFKMEGMVTDMTLARESQNSFEEYLATNMTANPGIDLTVTVLTTRLLHSLSCAKYKILIKEPMSSSISKTDVFELNSKFTDRMPRIKIPLPPMDERKKVVEDVDRDRRYAIDASLVRIMKSRKVLGHQQLVSECVEHNSRMFKPDINMIKKRIEDLISRDYLERDSENPNILKYLA
ncbi:hypothetical protein AALP_AA1G025800 [Arabis alpina]|uniref:Cullin-5 n=1 Tax=Arabis alpina TaxID=50452 RepID=A0A087HKM8_ARAAL|nr:hypothetical protein AALP_AA1G025800 [Arabis alpina]